MSALNIAIVIVTYQSAKDVERCILSLAHHLPWLEEGRAEVHVVDNASSDRTVEIVERLLANYSWLRLHAEENNLGFGSGNNVVLRGVEAKVYFLLNADAWLLADSVAPAFDLLQQSNDVGVIGLPLVYPDGSPQTYAFMPSTWHRWLLLMMGLRPIARSLLSLSSMRRLMQMFPFSANFADNNARPSLQINNPQSLKLATTLETREAFWVAGAAMALSHKFVAESGGFDPDIFLYGEDEDLCIQARKLGFKVVTLQSTPIVHKLGWRGEVGFRPAVAHLKYDSLKYFIHKNVTSLHNRMLMRLFLPFYVYGRNMKHFFRKGE